MILRTVIFWLLSTAAGFALAGRPPEEPKPVESPQGVGEPLTAPGGLPWEKGEAKRPLVPARRINSAREMLQTYGIDESQLANFVHHQPLGPGDEETLYRILFRLPFFGLAHVERWQEQDVSWPDLEADADAQRAKIFPVAGRVTRVVRKEVSPEAAAAHEYDHYFQVSLKLEGAPNPALVCARHVPQAWPLDTPMNEKADCLGLFLKLGEKVEEHSQLVFATLRMAWRPDRVDSSLGITDDQVWLAGQGLDVGLFDVPRARNQMPVGDTEGECFYALLGTLRRVDAAELRKRARRAIDIGALLQDPAAHHGDVSLVRGMARRVQKILLGEEDRDFRERFGVDHYYQVDVFVPLGEKEIRLGKGPQDKEGPVFDQSFLITLCTLEVPPGLAEGEVFETEVRLPAVFYKNWEFPSKYAEKFGDGKWKTQPAPMLMALEPEIITTEKSRGSDPFFIGLGVVAILALLGVVLGLLYSSWGDKKFKERSRNLNRAPGDVGPPK